MESWTSAQAVDTNVELVLGLMWVFPQVPCQEMPPFWYVMFLGGLLPPSQGLLNLLNPAQPSGGEFRYFLCFHGRVMTQSCDILGSWHVPLLIRELPPWQTHLHGEPNFVQGCSGVPVRTHQQSTLMWPNQPFLSMKSSQEWNSHQ